MKGIRIGCLWVLQADRQKGAMPWETSGLQSYKQRKSAEREKTMFFLILEYTPCFHHQLLLHSWQRSFLSPPGQAKTVMALRKIISDLSTMRVFHFEVLPFHKLLFLCVQRACYWTRWAGCGSHATIVLLFWEMSCTSVAGFVAKLARFVLCLSKSAFLSNH